MKLVELLTCCCSLLILTDGAREPANLPKSPCPEIYDYYENEKGVTQGILNFKNDKSEEYRLEVNMTIPVETNETIYINQVTPTFRVRLGEDIRYLIDYPFNHAYPTLNGIRMNGKVYCNSTPENGPNLTHVSRTHLLDTKILNLVNAALPDPKNKINKYPEICGVTTDDPAFSSNKSTVSSGEYPWLVALFAFADGKYEFKCGGNLISDKHVLTAAHCIKNLLRVEIDKRQLLVVLGTTNIRNWAVQGISRGVERSVVHPDYVRPADCDIALLTLDQAVDFDDNIRPICVWDDLVDVELMVGKEGVVAGWGLDEERKVFINSAKQVEVPVVAQDTCLLSDQRYFRLTSTRTFCAGDRSRTNPCSGDSGSGFVVNKNGTWSLRGIVSSGLKEKLADVCQSNLYTVFLDVAKYRKWIIDEIAQGINDNVFH